MNERPDSSAAIVNIAAYRFVALDRLAERRARLKADCEHGQLKGTILLSPEGINLFLAGTREAIDAFLVQLQQDKVFDGLTVKKSLSDVQPFARLKVKLKQEIIPFGIDGIDPETMTSPAVLPQTLRQWLDEGREITLLDVRNDYEIEHGTFVAARTLSLDHFRHLPAAVDQLSDDLKQRPVVMFCTGGIRCEKAGPYLQQQGFAEVYQLDGGILNYFAECGGEHYEGDCFVFDERVAVDPQLRPIGASDQCDGFVDPAQELPWEGEAPAEPLHR